jgi:hypothetical protein
MSEQPKHEKNVKAQMYEDNCIKNQTSVGIIIKRSCRFVFLKKEMIRFYEPCRFTANIFYAGTEENITGPHFLTS